MSYSTLFEVQHNKNELAKLRGLTTVVNCSSCFYSKNPDAFEDVLRICMIDGVERSKRAVCELWTKKTE